MRVTVTIGPYSVVEIFTLDDSSFRIVARADLVNDAPRRSVVINRNSFVTGRLGSVESLTPPVETETKASAASWLSLPARRLSQRCFLTNTRLKRRGHDSCQSALNNGGVLQQLAPRVFATDLSQMGRRV